MWSELNELKHQKDWHCYFASRVHTRKLPIDISIPQRENLNTQYRSFLFQEIFIPRKGEAQEI